MSYTQSQSDLREHLREQVDFLLQSASRYDSGAVHEARRLATTVRTLVHRTKQEDQERKRVIRIDRMELDGIGNALAIADAVLRQVKDVPIPVPIEEIAAAAGVTDIQELQSDGFEGALIAPDHKSSGIILVNRRSRPERRRFTVGHELCHLLSPWHKPPQGGFRCTKADMFALEDGGKDRMKMEVDANQFSASMLMPAKYFRQDLMKFREPGLEHVVQLSDRYATSKVATARRFVSLRDEPSAVVLSKDGVIESISWSKGFPYFSVRRGQAIPARSLTARFGGSSNSCSDTDVTEPALWLSSSLARGVEMLEQVLIQGGGYRITLLSIDESESDDEDEEYVNERSEWDPRFR
jgi:Zn-dependent peptidase ImmA (M78 family)